jgi:hypothetical protein
MLAAPSSETFSAMQAASEVTSSPDMIVGTTTASNPLIKSSVRESAFYFFSLFFLSPFLHR